MKVSIEINQEEIESVSVLIESLKKIKGVTIKSVDQKTQYILDLEKTNDEMNDLYILMNQQSDFHNLSLGELSKLSLNIFEKFPDKFNWQKISLLELPEKFIDDNIYRMSIETVSSKQLSEKFIIRHSNILNMSIVFLVNPVTPTLEEMFSSEIQEYNLEIAEKNYKFITQLDKLYITGDEIIDAKKELRNAGIELILNSGDEPWMNSTDQS